ncbi:MAG: polysaccharide pyruvyl transferase CsaB [bacterium]
MEEKNTKIMNRVLIVGYYGFNNAGDEMILASLLEQLRKDSSVIPIVLSNEADDTEKSFNVKAFNRWNIFRCLWEIIRSDVLIVGGGGLLQDYTSSLSLYFYLFFIIAGKMLRRKVFIWSVGIGPVIKKFNRYLLKKILKIAGCITVRDSFSFNWIKTNSDNLPNLFLVQDQVFSWTKIYNGHENSKKIAVCLKDTISNENLRSFVISLQSFCKDRDIEMIFVPFNKVRDLNICSKYSSEMNSSVFKWKKIEQLAEFFSTEVSYMASMRFHGAVVACKLGIPFIGIVDSKTIVPDKIELLLNDIKMSNIIDLAKGNWEDIPKYLFNHSNYMQENIFEELTQKSFSTSVIFFDYVGQLHL